ncbi:hypothetical protein ALC62_10608 [Cyphomyrmex costatus]|uniref:Uncharacterized protein n=1 Tax=Cyphomyrmex costatus TaxID=456900 RepID=A0A195CD49_9HYME|nr:hypothetical protein ALC62_10608 [Cyphomyrmex costatus]
MHLGGEGESRGELRSSRSRSRRSRAESSRVESRPATVSAHAPPTDASVCTLLARSLGKLTRASENAGESRSADRGTYATSFTGVETGASTASSSLNWLDQCRLYPEEQRDIV